MSLLLHALRHQRNGDELWCSRAFVPRELDQRQDFGGLNSGGETMSAATINALQIYEEKYLSLRSRFLTQFEDEAEADDCLQELYHRFSNYVEYCRREPDAKLMKVFMIMAGKVSSEKLAEKKLQRENRLLNRIKHQAAQALKEGVDFRQLALRLVGNIRQPRLQQLSTVSR